MMVVNNNRRFRSNAKRSYYIQNAPKDAGHKYVLTVMQDGMYRACTDLFYDTLYFDTIKEAQRHVLFNEDMITHF